MVHAVGRLRPASRPAGRLRLHGVGRPGRHQHGDRRRSGHRSTASRCCCCPATCSPPGSSNPVLQELEDPQSLDVSVNDCFKPVSRYWDRVNRPEQLPLSLLAAMRVLTDPVETGAVTLVAPAGRAGRGVGLAGRPLRAPGVARRAARDRAAPWPAPSRCSARGRAPAGRGRRRRHLLRRHRGAARASPRPPASRSRRPRRARAPCRTTTRSPWARSVPRAPRPPTRWPREADVVIGVGTRYSDFTTASKTVFANPGRPLRQPQRRLVRRPQARRPWPPSGDARRGLEQLTDALAGWRAPPSTPSGRPRSRGSGTRPSRARTTSATRRCRRSRR